MIERKLNYKSQQKDARDYKYVSTSRPTSLPNTFSLQDRLGPILDQGQLGSCVSNAFAQYIHMMTNRSVSISRLYHYYCGRALDQTSSLEDSGLSIRQAAKIIGKYGACQEPVWPYDITKFNELPPLSVFKSCNLFRSYTYSFLNQDLNSIKSCLSVTKRPVIFGFDVYDSFMRSVRGVISTPIISKETLLGGHCMLIIGYNDVNQRFTCVNSWGRNWGTNGLCFMPYNYILNSKLCMDFCQLNFVF